MKKRKGGNLVSLHGATGSNGKPNVATARSRNTDISRVEIHHRKLAQGLIDEPSSLIQGLLSALSSNSDEAWIHLSRWGILRL